ncbi:MAG: hypothetical protein ABIM85_03455, partial [candidate division WOR-3 bacterium]
FIFFISSNLISLNLIAQEHPGEHPGRLEKIRPDDVKRAITDYVNTDSKLKGGYFLIWDPELKQVWKLNFKELHKEVRVLSDGTYFMCSDFKVADGETILDIDFWLKEDMMGLKVVDIKIHKISGKERFKYEGEKIKELK